MNTNGEHKDVFMKEFDIYEKVFFPHCYLRYSQKVIHNVCVSIRYRS